MNPLVVIQTTTSLDQFGMEYTERHVRPVLAAESGIDLRNHMEYDEVYLIVDDQGVEQGSDDWPCTVRSCGQPGVSITKERRSNRPLGFLYTRCTVHHRSRMLTLNPDSWVARLLAS